MAKTHYRKKAHRKRTIKRKHKGGSKTPTKEKLAWASKGLSRKSRPPPLKLSKSPSAFDLRKRDIIKNPLKPEYTAYISGLNEFEPLAEGIDDYYIIHGDEPKEIFKFTKNDTLESTGFAYIVDRKLGNKWVKM